MLLNMHHLINSFRPHHAREEVIATLQAKLEAKQRLLGQLEAACANAFWDDVRGSDGESQNVEDERHVSSAFGGPAVETSHADPRTSNLQHLLTTLDEIPVE